MIQVYLAALVDGISRAIRRLLSRHRPPLFWDEISPDFELSLLALALLFTVLLLIHHHPR